MFTLLLALTVAAVLLAAANTALFVLLWLTFGQKRDAAPPPAAPDDAADSPDSPEARRLRLDESFENLMAYQVRLGRGDLTGGDAG